MFPRSQPSGAQNRKRKKNQQEIAQSLHGSLDKFVVREEKAIENPSEKFVSNSNLNDYVEECDDEDLVSNSNDFVEKFVDEELVGNTNSNDFDEPYVDEIALNTFEPSVWDNLNSKTRLDKNQTVDKDLQELIKKDTAHWKQVLIRIISVVKCFAKCNFAFHGTNEFFYEESDDNFLGLLQMIAEFDPVMQHHFRMIEEKETHHHYLSHKIQNELIEMLASNIKSAIITKIKEAKYFSVILDCTPDVSHEEQHVTLIIRCVDVSSVPIKVEEFFLKFLVIEDTSSKGLFDVVQDVLISLDLDSNCVRGLGYDNGTNMKGKHQGVQKRFLDINPRAFYMPCDCRCLNLALCDMANSCHKARIFFGACKTIYDVFSNSTNWRSVLLEYIDDSTLKSLCVTRLESHVDSVRAIKTQLGEIRDALIKLAYVCDDVLMCRDAQSLLNFEFSSFEFILCLVIWHEILYRINLVSKKLQSKDMLLHIVVKTLEGLITYFEKYKESGFDLAFIEAEEIAENIGVEPEFPIRKIGQSTRESFKTDYFLVLVDITLSHLRSRFEHMKHFESIFGFLFDASKLLKTKDDELKKCCLNLEIALTHGDDIDIDGKYLYMELQILQGMLPCGAYDKEKPWTSIQIMEFVRKADIFPHVLLAYKILLTIPVTLLSAERNLTKIKLLKSYLPSTMSQERLNGLAILSIENELLENVDCDRLIEDFASRIAPIYHFR